MRLIQTDFLLPKNFERCREATVLFVNNANQVFQSRSTTNSTERTLDWHVARLFAGMKTGARMICFEPLLELETERMSACFFRIAHTSESGATSWTRQSMKPRAFVTYRKVSDTWTCPDCQTENPLLEPSSDQCNETFHEMCIKCYSRPRCSTAPRAATLM